MRTPELTKAILSHSKKNQKQLSEIANVRQATVSDWKNGNASISFDKAMEICETLNINICKLLTNGRNASK